MCSLLYKESNIAESKDTESGENKMLNIYTKKEYLPCNKKVITDIESFFSMVRLKDDGLTREILKSVEEAEFIDTETFRDRFGRELFIGNLSTGAKGLLCIYYYPEYVFDIRELGVNCRNILSIFPAGNILVTNPNFIISDYNDNELRCYVNNQFFDSFSDVNLQLGGLDEDDI